VQVARWGPLHRRSAARYMRVTGRIRIENEGDAFRIGNGTGLDARRCFNRIERREITSRRFMPEKRSERLSGLLAMCAGRRERALNATPRVCRARCLNEDLAVGLRVYALVNGHVVISRQSAVPAFIRGPIVFIREERVHWFPGAGRRCWRKYCRAIVGVCVEVSRCGTFWPCPAIRQSRCCFLQVDYSLSSIYCPELSQSPRGWIMHVGGQIGGRGWVVRLGGGRVPSKLGHYTSCEGLLLHHRPCHVHRELWRAKSEVFLHRRLGELAWSLVPPGRRGSWFTSKTEGLTAGS